MISIHEEEPPKLSSRPVLRARSRTPFPVRNILVAMDSKHDVPRAIEYGKRLARLCNSKLTLMSVYRVKHSFELLDGLEAVKTTEQEMEQALQHLESLKAQVRRDFSGCDTYLRAGIPEDEISWTATALGIDLIVMGECSRHSTRYHGDGIEAKIIRQRTGCPVIVVQEDGRHH